MGLRTALFFAHECAPHHRIESTMGAQRPAQFAKYLPEFGWRAFVVCCDAEQRRSAQPKDRAAIEADVGRRLAEADPEASLLLPTPSLASDGAIDAVWNSLQEREVGGALAVARQVLTLAKYASGDHSQSWQPCARWAAEVLVQSGDIDVCVGEHGPDAGLFLARWFREEHGVPWVADFRDPILRAFDGLRRRLYRPVARRLVDTASHVVNVTPFWAELDAEFFGLPTTCIPNGFDPDEYASDEPVSPSASFTVSYVGNLVPQQPIEMALEAWASFVGSLAPDERERVRFVYRGLAVQRVRSAALAAGLDATVDIAERIGRDETIRLMRRSDLLLLFSVASADPREPTIARGLYPGKVFENFGARRPILCIPGDRGQLDALLAETRSGVIRSSRDEVTGFLVDAFAEWKRAGCLRHAPDEVAVARYERRAQAGAFASVLDAVAQAPRNRR